MTSSSLPSTEKGPADIHRPVVSLVMPCHDEENALGYAISKLMEALTVAEYQLLLVVVEEREQGRHGRRQREARGTVTRHRLDARLSLTGRQRCAPRHHSVNGPLDRDDPDRRAIGCS